jgi:ABC-type polysaccharide/polyol phosphate transport system ATPase subunit
VSAMIEVKDVRKSFRIPSVRRETVRQHFFNLLRPVRYEELRVLDGISFEVRRGEAFGIMGRNGSGKSTLLRILSGIYRPDAGSAVVHAPITPILNLGLGWNDELTARDNIFLTGTAMGLTLAELRGQLDHILAFAELERFADLELKHYSSGMSARLAYAVAFNAVREVLLLDEIFAVGDVAFKHRCERRYRELVAEGRTVILVSHDPKTIADNCSRALLLEGGRIVMNDRSEHVAKAYAELLEAA